MTSCPAPGARRPGERDDGHNGQLDLFRRESPSHARVVEQLRAADLDALTPLQALTLLADLQRELEAPE